MKLNLDADIGTSFAALCPDTTNILEAVTAVVGLSRWVAVSQCNRSLACVGSPDYAMKQIYQKASKV